MLVDGPDREEMPAAPTEPPPRMSIIEALTEIAKVVKDALKLPDVERDPAGVLMAVRELVRESDRVHARNLVLERERRLVSEIVNGRGPR